jgi:hypothetical protein
MAASVSFTPSECRVGTPVVVSGAGFLPATKLSINLFKTGHDADFGFDIDSDAEGGFSGTDEANAAQATLTSDATNVSVDDTVTIGAVTYTFKASPTTVANQVKIGASASATLDNLKAAINLTGTPGTDYGSNTVIHPTVYASTKTATTLLLFAKAEGTGGNSLASTEGSTHLSFGAGTFAGGNAATGYAGLRFAPNSTGVWTASVTDGTSTATATVQVWSA